MLRIKKRGIRRLGLRLPTRLRQVNAWLAHRIHHMTRAQRIICTSLAGVVLLSVIVPTALTIIKNQSYQLSAEIQQLIGTPNKNLSSKITYNSEKDSWQFNQSDIPIGSSSQQAAMPSVADLKAQIGGSGKKDESLYAVDMPTHGSKGITYYDTNTNLSFSLVPQFSLGDGRRSDTGHVIYPSDHGTKLIYTAKGNGMKEDIVLTRPIGDKIEFSYKLKLPETLTAKVQADGSLGVFSPDPVLFGNISFGDGQDKEKILSARKSAAKDHLLFVLPAPVIVEAGGTKSKAPARFSLSSDILTVKASGLANLHYPLSIDPSVVVTSSSDFETGNNESNIDYSSGAISRGTLTGGSVGGWTSTASNPYTARWGMGTTMYNGYIYVVGGITGSGASNNVSYAQINSDGTVGAWAATTTLPAAREYSSVVAYNGYMYAYGGYTSGTSALNTVVYAPINSDGTVGSWTTSSNTMGTATCRAGSAIYNGYMYAVGGATGTVATDCGNSSATNTGAVQYAPIQGNGDVGTWSSSSNTVTARKDVGVAAYNGYLYAIGGTTDGTSTSTTVQYASFKTTGDINSWTTSATTVTGNYRFGLSAYKGYLYLVGGNSGGTTISYASITADGDVGAFRTSTTIGTSRYGLGAIGYKGYIYITGGYDNPNTTYLNSTIYAAIDPAGTTNSFGTVANNFTTARALACSVAYNGYLYAIGGSTSDNGANNVTTVQYTSINSSTGNVGSWSSTTALPEARGSAGCTAYGGYVYVIGGYTGTNVALDTIRYAPINTNGTLGTWVTTAPTLPDTKVRSGVFTYTTSAGTYLYSIGGEAGTGSNHPKSYYSLIGSSGSLGSWSTASHDLTTSYTYRSFTRVGKYIYAIGGWINSPTTAYTAVEYTTIGSNGDLGTWSTTTSLNTATGFSNGTTVNGCVYALGGENSSSTSLANVQYACPAADGTIAAWYNAPNLSVATTDMGVTSYNGYIYGVGGYTTSVQATTQFAAVNNGGSGAASPWLQKVGNIGGGLYGHGFAYSNGYFYLAGGDTSGGGSSATANTWYAPLNDDTTIGTWTAGTSLTTARHSHMTYISNGYMYVVGGSNSAGTLQSSVEYAPINANGTLGSWSTATGSLPTAHKQSASVAYGGYLYSLGGNNGSLSTTVYYANASSGNISSWSTTTSLPTAVRNDSAVVYNGFLYVIGGIDGSGPTGRVTYAAINSNGTLGSWQYATWVPLGGATTAIAANGNIYASTIDGASCSGATFRASIYSDGSLSPFQQTTSAASCSAGNGGATYANGLLYVPLGSGVIAGARLDMTARIGRYSKLINLNGDYGLTGLTYNGTLSNGGIANLGFKSASSNGVFGSKQLASSLTGGFVSCSAANIMYVQALATLDDTYTSVYPDANSAASNLTDFTLNYASARAPTSQRLAHGKYFSGEVQQGLDTCNP